ncbi:MAG TPA: UbiX family flavin prenyltransferase [Thermoanaerobaculia bacterium]|jgi:4-hydroxy-3-polyprenylbenzoate decarboxylase|nr:UbiX family flavin prenyltransferase [Thermoanaerobaculia bacterium]
MPHRLALLVTGASGMLLPRHVLGRLAAHPEIERIHLVVSAGASQVLRHELGEERTGAADLLAAAVPDPEAWGKVLIHRDGELDAPIASGSYRLTGTAVLPCSSGTLGALATGSARTLVHRTGAVALKERWPLVLGFRETPYSLVHIENMRRLILSGAVILPPVPAFYIGGEDLGRFLDHYTLRLLDRFGIPETGEPGLRWGG